MERNIITLLATALLALSMQAQTPNIVGYEYWFDQNDAARISVQVPPSSTVDLTNAPLNTTGLSLGQHLAHLRWKDRLASGQTRWSSVVTRALQVGQPSPWEITAIRYWWSNSANPPVGSDMRYKYFDTPQALITYAGVLDLCDYPTGAQVLKLQLRDNHGHWSSVVTRPVQINATGVLAAPGITASSSTFCPGDVVTFTATPQTGTGYATPSGFDWEIPAGNGWSAQPSTSNTITVTIGSVSGSVQAAATNYCGNSVYATFAVNIAPAPAQPTSIGGPLQACIGSAATFTTPQQAGVTYEWAITGGWTASGGPGNSIQTTIGSSNANITVTPFNACGIPGLTRDAEIVVSAPPNAGGNGTLAICSSAAPADLFAALQGNPQGGGTWSGPSATTGPYNPVTMAPGNYVYTVNGTGGCAPANATVTVNEVPLPNAGSNGSLSICSNGQTVDMRLSLGGTPAAGGSWNGPSSTNGFFDPAIMLAGAYTYTVTGAAPCPDASATLLVNIDQAPNAGTGGTLSLCANDAPVDLFTQLQGNPETGGTWSGLSATDSLFDPASMSPGNYTYTLSGSGTCGSSSANILVSVDQLPNAGEDASLNLCSNSGPQNMLFALSGSPDTGGNWMGTSPTVGIFDPSTMAPGPYTYTIDGSGACPNASATLSVSVILAPNAGMGGPVAICSEEPALDLFTRLGGSPQVGGTWSGPGGASNGLFIPGQSPQGLYTYFVVGSGPCANASAQLEVDVIDLQLNSINGPAVITQVESLTYTVAPSLVDAVSFSWSIPTGWTWAIPDSTSGTAVLIPSAQAGSGSICVTAYGGECAGDSICLVIDNTVSMADPSSTTPFHLVSYPNPNNGSFTVSASGIIEPLHVRLLNAMGQEVSTFNLGIGDPSKDLEQFSSGSYLLHWTSGMRQGTQRIVVAQ